MAQTSAEKTEQTGPAKKTKWSQCHKVSCQGRQGRLCQMENKQSHQSRSPDREEGESQGQEEPHLGEKKKVRAEARGGKGELHSEGILIPG